MLHSAHDWYQKFTIFENRKVLRKQPEIGINYFKYSINSNEIYKSIYNTIYTVNYVIIKEFYPAEKFV